MKFDIFFDLESDCEFVLANFPRVCEQWDKFVDIVGVDPEERFVDLDENFGVAAV